MLRCSGRRTCAARRVAAGSGGASESRRWAAGTRGEREYWAEKKVRKKGRIWVDLTVVTVLHKSQRPKGEQEIFFRKMYRISGTSSGCYRGIKPIDTGQPRAHWVAEARRTSLIGVGWWGARDLSPKPSRSGRSRHLLAHAHGLRPHDDDGSRRHRPATRIERGVPRSEAHLTASDPPRASIPSIPGPIEIHLLHRGQASCA